MPAPGGVAPSGVVVARVGAFVITQPELASRIAIDAHEEPRSERVVPVPPAYTSCIAYLRTHGESGGHAAAATTAQLKGRCSALHQRLVEDALKELITSYWQIGGARELRVPVSGNEASQALEKDLSTEFNSEAALEHYLKATGENIPDMLFSLQAQLAWNNIRSKLKASTGPVTAARIASYYAENKSRLMVEEQRDLWLVRTKRSAALARQIKQELQSGVSFASIAKRYAAEQPPYMREAFLSGLTPHVFAEPTLNDAIFSARRGVVTGPVRLELEPTFDHRSARDIRNIDGYYIFEVNKITPGYLPTLAQVKAKLAEELPRALQQSAVAAFKGSWIARWRAKTDCLPGLAVRECQQVRASA